MACIDLYMHVYICIHVVHGLHDTERLLGLEVVGSQHPLGPV